MKKAIIDYQLWKFYHELAHTVGAHLPLLLANLYLSELWPSNVLLNLLLNDTRQSARF